MCLLCQWQTNVNGSTQRTVTRGRWSWKLGAGYRTFATKFAALRAANAVLKWVHSTLDDDMGIGELWKC